MKEDIRYLVRLQSIEFEIRDLDRRHREAPERIAELEQGFQERLEEIGGERLRHESLVQERNTLCVERDDLDRRLRTAQQKLMQVSNQREYSAVLNEIDTTKGRYTELEAAITSRNAEIDELAGPASEADERISTEQGKLTGEKNHLESEMGTVASRLAELKSLADEIKTSVSAEFLGPFGRIFGARGGIAMAAVDNGACGACHLKLRPQVISLCKRGEELVYCENCRRILYDETVPTPLPTDGAAPEAAGTNGAGAPPGPAAAGP